MTKLDDAYEAADAIHRVFHELVPGLQFKRDGRKEMAVAAFHVAVEHFVAVVTLAREDLHGSASSLLRLEYEAILRGMWMAKAATDKQLDAYVKDKVPTAKDMVGQISDAVPGWEAFHKKSYGALSGLTHAGIAQLNRRHMPDAIGSNYEEAFVVEMIFFAGHLAIIAASEMMFLCDAKDAIARMSELQSDIGRLHQA